MATQTILLNALPGVTNLEIVLLTISDEPIVMASAIAVELAGSDDSGRYIAVFEDVPAGRYRVSGLINGQAGFVNETVTLGATTGTYLVDSELDLDARLASILTAIGNIAISGNGEFATTFQVRNLGNAVANAKVTIFQGSTQVGVAYTGTNGNAAYNLDAGSYTINVSASGFNPVSGQAFSVSAAGNVAVAMTAVGGIAPPSSPELCTVRCSVVGSDGLPIQYARARAIVEDGSTTSGALVAEQVIEGSTNAQGFVDLVLIRKTQFTQGGLYKIVVQLPNGRIFYDKQVEVPNQATALLSSL